ncbi:MAG: hypothetical protein H6Q14_1305, partial [Bacteroidetes bacterium]|nr:hypothetical protein [Bacteroidota bacterium]
STTGDTILTAATIPVFAATGTASFSVGIGSLTLGSSTTYSSLSTTFTKTLVAGYTYTLTARLKNNFIIGGVRWATGNVRSLDSGSTFSFYSSQESYSGVWNGGDYFCWNTLNPTSITSSNTTGVYKSSTDPCMKVSTAGTWRMPTTTETLSLVNSGYVKGTYSSNTGYFFKTASVPATAYKTSYLFLPFTAQKLRAPGSASLVSPSADDHQAGYWTKTLYTTNRAYFMSLHTSSITYNWDALTNWGMTIRCVHDL